MHHPDEFQPKTPPAPYPGRICPIITYRRGSTTLRVRRTSSYQRAILPSPDYFVLRCVRIVTHPNTCGKEISGDAPAPVSMFTPPLSNLWARPLWDPAREVKPLSHHTGIDADVHALSSLLPTADPRPTCAWCILKAVTPRSKGGQLVGCLGRSLREGGGLRKDSCRKRQD